MGRVRSVSCPRCKRAYPPNTTTFHCDDCHTVLEAIMDLAPARGLTLDQVRQRRDLTIWRWIELLPVGDPAHVVSLGEGSTPLRHARRLGERLGLRQLYIKNDGMLPTGSLKDRSMSVAISKAVELGIDTAVVASTGNGAASTAAYAAAAGIRSILIVPKETDLSKIAQAKAYGAVIVAVEGDFDVAVSLYRQALSAFGWYGTLGNNPYRNEGKKSYAYEFHDQLDGRVPDWVIHPTSGGMGLFALRKGYLELRELGWCDRMPRLVAAQAEAAAPIALAVERGLSDVEPVRARATVAESIQVGNPRVMGWRALEAIRESHGTATASSDAEILEATALLGTLEGVYAEPAGAVSIAAAATLRRRGVIDSNALVVCNMTGTGLKQPGATAISPEELRPIPAQLAALEHAVGERGKP
jgi:threonine synthase